jgi:periplasmic divalent cation tolerance protein
VLLVIKSSRGRIPALLESLQKEHSYEVPEALAVAVVDGAANYLNWIQASLESIFSSKDEPEGAR